ncbi:MAG: NADPH-dependent F420 reductase [Haliea sp.]|jgi:NADPH-dependent F420 reductase|uniref:NADPH-dependent F420 reductase n=1 Tax=Haliea sp. TaxID=1932666 RepID=UPI000C437672|nr:NADPH-dependent F420 reductase [Haliea sp.]MBM70103.1 NADPH-dependent F420 reductase [Haliea sp.]|tara:strand:- start:13406 stop:14089 length:684 start_codon:yes stop_codon:yes gene_type:complete
MTTESLPVLAILGGTGDLGTGLARRWAQAGYRVIIGSRTQEKAEQAASDLRQVMAARGATVNVESMENLAAAEAADIVAITVPFSHQKSTLELVAPALQGKILIDVTVPLVPPRVARVQLPPEGSAGQIAQDLLGEGVDVVSAFQNVAAAHLQDEGAVDCDVLVCGNKKEARAAVITLVEAAGLRGFHAGMIANAAAAEALTSVLITINKQYSCHAGIRISGLDSHG